jgi:ATP-binding cassette, subfamily B, multidrug efflux pump
MAQSRLRRLGTYLRPHWKICVWGVVALLTVNLLAVYIPWLIREAVDKPLGYQQMLGYVANLALLSTLMLVVRLASRIWIFGIGRKVEYDLKQRIFEHVLGLEPAYFAVNTVGDLINRATSDVDSVRRMLGFAVLSLVNTLFAYGFRMPLMLAISWKLTLLSVAIYPLMMVVVQLFSDRMRLQQQQVQEELSSLSELIQEDMSGISLVKIYAQEENERRAFAQRNQALLDANLDLSLTRNLLFAFLKGVASFSLLILLWFGAADLAEGTLSIGDFVAMLLYLEGLAFPTALMGFTITAYQRGEVSIDRIEAILSVEPKIQDKPGAIALPVQQVKGRLRAEDLEYTFAMMPGEKGVRALDHVSFTIQPRTTVAIVGPIGSGKSTLANALPHLLEVAPNQLFLDGYDLTQIRLTDLRGAIAYVPQESFLFSTSIAHNICYGRPEATAADAVRAAQFAQIHEEILNFPQTYDTIVGERGITLSGGQRQRTALARALLVDAPILILDDALSSVDNQTATRILTGLADATDRKTVVFISHQMSAAAMADQIFVMEAGKIVQTGSHDELVGVPGLYQTLWNQHKLEEVLR